jgi:hypothetical protein
MQTWACAVDPRALLHSRHGQLLPLYCDKRLIKHRLLAVCWLMLSGLRCVLLLVHVVLLGVV